LTKQTPFRVVEFSHDSLADLIDSLSSLSHPHRSLKKNQHLEYLFGYLSALGAKTIVLESQYIDHDYLEDYAGYYVRCFNSYSRTTSRLHFFDISFNEKQFKNVVLKSPNGRLGKKLNQSYLGFMVIKPLPQTVVGRTCFKTYGDDGNRRHFPTLHEYRANLFGISLTINSLAYQEQDKVVAACATSALWSLFHGSGKIFHHPIPSPVEITKAATLHIPDSGKVPHDARSIHHSGLTPTQMAHSVKFIGMEPYLEGASDVFAIKNTVYAYLRARIPVLLGFNLKDESDPAEDPEDCGKHAVSIAGFSLGHAEPKPYGKTGILTVASRIDKVYVHDDQVGPFAKMEFSTSNKLATNWLDKNGKLGNVFADPFLLMVPLYHKIRIPYGIISGKIEEFDAIIEQLRNAEVGLLLSQRLVWDIYLSNVNDVKSDIIKSATLDSESKRAILLINMPKYLWRATAYEGTQKILDILFDATDIEQGAILVTAISYDAGLKSQIDFVSPFIAKHPKICESVKMIFQAIARPHTYCS